MQPAFSCRTKLWKRPTPKQECKRIHEIPGIKQEALAIELGDDRNQKKISLLEGKETIEPPILDELAKALKVPAEAIKNFDNEAALT